MGVAQTENLGGEGGGGGGHAPSELMASNKCKKLT